MLRTESPYGSDTLAPWTRFVYAFDERTGNPYGLASIIAPYQIEKTRNLNKLFEMIRSPSFIIDTQALTSGDANQNPDETIRRLVENRRKPGSITPIDVGNRQRIGDVVQQVDSADMNAMLAAINLLNNDIELVKPPVSTGNISRLNSGQAISTATEAAGSPLQYGINRFKSSFESYGKLVLSNIARFRFADVNKLKPLNVRGHQRDVEYNVIGGGTIKNAMTLQGFRLALLEVPVTRSEKEENFKFLAEMLAKTSDPNLVKWIMLLHPYLDQRIKQQIEADSNKPDPRAEAENQMLRAKIENMEAGTQKQIEQTKGELPKRMLNMAKIREMEDDEENVLNLLTSGG